MTPLLRPVWWRASAGSFSSTATEIPGNRSVICIAVESPTMPPPITARSKSAIHPPRSTPHTACIALLSAEIVLESAMSAGYHLSAPRILGSERDAQPAIDSEHLPGDVGVLLAGQPGDTRRDLIRLGVTAQRQLCVFYIDALEPRSVALVNAFHDAEAGRDEPQCHRVDEDAVGREIDGKVARGLLQPSLGYGIGQCRFSGEAAVNRGDVHDAAVAPFRHAAGNCRRQ